MKMIEGKEYYMEVSSGLGPLRLIGTYVKTGTAEELGDPRDGTRLSAIGIKVGDPDYHVFMINGESTPIAVPSILPGFPVDANTVSIEEEITHENDIPNSLVKGSTYDVKFKSSDGLVFVKETTTSFLGNVQGIKSFVFEDKEGHLVIIPLDKIDKVLHHE